MKQISGNCILPFGLWGEDPPDHLITSIEIIDNLYIVTGDKLGQMIVWQIECDNKILPLWYLLGHSGSISIISKSMIAEYNDLYIISVSSNREMGVWNCSNGRCVRLERHLSSEHIAIKAYRSPNSKTAMLVCCGHYSGIQVIDSMTMRLLFCLQSRAHSDWVRSVCVFKHKHREMDVVLGLSIAGAITMWTIESLDGLREDKVFYETESKMLLLTCPISISICPSKPRIVMVLASNSVQIYDAASWSLIGEHNCPESCFLSGWFLSAETIVLRKRNGQCRLYSVPIGHHNDGNSLSELRPMCWLECDNDGEVTCEAVTVSDGELRVAVGCVGGRIHWWHRGMDDIERALDQDVIVATDSAVVKDRWRDMNMASLTRPFKNEYSITCCHCEPSIDCVMMGTSSGDILVMELLQSVAVALFCRDNTSLPFQVLQGHTKSVLALRYAKMSSGAAGGGVSGGDSKWLWSGGEDFSVRLWSLDSRLCVNVFHCHCGPVTSFLVGPLLGLTKTRHDGRIMAPKKAAAEAEPEVLRPINAGTWFGQRLYVSLDDSNGVAFLSLETRRVVLQLSLFSAIETIGWRRDQVSVVLSSADGCVTVWDLGSGLLERREEGQTGEDIVEACSDHLRVSCPPPLLPRVAHLKDRLKSSGVSSPLLVHPIPIGRGRWSQILLCDTEALLVSIHQRQDSSSKALIEAQVLLSLIQRWTQDSCLDTTLETSIGLVRPPRPVCHGHINTRTRTLSFPLRRQCQDPIGGAVALLSGVALCHALNNLPDSLLPSSWPRLASMVDPTGIQKQTNTGNDNRTEVRQVCCFFATSMAIGSLADLLSSMNMAEIPLILETLIQKYQDRCLEVREAARTLLHAALDLLSSDQRHELVQLWSVHGRVLPARNNNNNNDNISSNETWERSTDNSVKASRSMSSIFEAPSISDWRYWPQGQLSSEMDQIQSTAFSFLAIVGCRYGSPDLQLCPASNAVSASLLRSQPLDKAIHGFGLDDYHLARTTCGFLMGLLTSSSGDSGHKTHSHWSTMRCLAITVLGQGFPVWEPYLEISMLFTKLLETVAPAERILSTWSQGQLLTDEMDAVHSARSSLHAIALARPKVFATALSIEVLRQQTQPGQGSLTSSPASLTTSAAGIMNNGIPVSNGTQSLKMVVSGSTSQPPLLAARHEVIEVIRVLCEKKTREIHDVLPEIMDILLACLSKLDLRQYDLPQLFPPILLFRIASSHTASGKVCVGTRTGHVAFYDVKIGKYNTSPGHGGPVTSVTFSPDGKQMASYSMPDNSVCIWQLFSSGLFGMGSSHQVKLASKLSVPPVAVSDTVTEEDSSLLLWLEWSENKAIHLVTNAGLINKIKL